MEPNRLDRAMAYLDKMPVAQSGAGGHNTTLRVACECFRFGLSRQEAWLAMSWYNDNRCSPPWKEHELRHKLTDAEKIVSLSGEHAARVWVAAKKYNRAFVAPPPVEVKPDPRPVYLQSEQQETLWWEKRAHELGLTLAEFDRRCGNG